MTKRTVTFNCEDSLHMKAIAVLIQKASAFRSSIWLTRG
ncbi:MAG: HPr family phosphocarrier protein, partial [Oscillospiraceae bacterium]|nr:HPr family phosphocarrier protein [Oscillospiraceae bacterium]